MLLTMWFVNFYQTNLYFFYLIFFLILCDISTEFYLNSKFIIIKVIMCSNYTYDFFSKIFQVFNEMEMEINVINNKIFTKL